MYFAIETTYTTDTRRVKTAIRTERKREREQETKREKEGRRGGGEGGKADERCSYVTIKNALILNSPWIGPVASCGPVRFKRSVSRRAISHVARALLLLLVFTTPPFQGNGLLSSRGNHRGEFSIQCSFF